MIKLVALLLIAGSCLHETAIARPVKVPQHFVVEFIPEGRPVPGIPFQVRVRLTALSDFCKPFTISYDKSGNLELLSAPVTQHSVDSGQTIEAYVIVRCQPNDTSSIRLLFTCSGKGSGDQSRGWFASNDTSVTILEDYPAPPFPHKQVADPQRALKEQFQKELQEDSARYRRIDKFQPIQPQPMGSASGQLHPLESIVSLECLVPVPPLPGVPVLSRSDFQAMRLQPIPAQSLEVWWVEGTHYVRPPGESLFTCLFCFGQDPKRGDLERKFGTLAGLPKDYRHSLVFYVPQDKSVAPVEAVAAPLTFLGTWYRFQLYRGRATLEQMWRLQQQGIAVWRDADYPSTTDNPVLIKYPELRQQLFRSFDVVDTAAVMKRAPLRWPDKLPDKQGSLAP